MPSTFDNRKTAIRYRISSFLLTILVIILLSVVFLSNLIPKDATLITKRNITLVVVGIYVLFGIYRYWLDLYYFYFSYQNQTIVIRFYSLRPFSQLKRSIEIPKHSLADYRIVYDWSGLKPGLVLVQKTIEGNKAFPAVSISALSKHQISVLETALKAIKN